MKQSLHIGKEPNLRHIVIASALFHLVLMVLATLPLKTREPEYKSYFVNLVPSPEIRRDIKTSAKKDSRAPEVKAAEKAKQPAAKETVKVKPEPKADMSLENTKKVSKEIERLQAIKNLSKKREQKDAQIKKGRETDEEIAQAIEVIRKKTHDSAKLSGGAPGAQTSMDADSYYALVTRKIWSEWIYPDIEASGLEVIISIKIGKDGRVISQEIEKSSGNTIFDRSAAKAVSKASPLPPPVAEMEIGVRFYL